MAKQNTDIELTRAEAVELKEIINRFDRFRKDTTKNLYKLDVEYESGDISDELTGAFASFDVCRMFLEVSKRDRDRMYELTGLRI